jgi:hypothetical protein
MAEGVSILCIAKIEHLAASTGLSVRKIHEKIAGKASRSVVGEIVKRMPADRIEVL